MIGTLKHRKVNFKESTFSINNKYDPTRTTALRNLFVKKMDERFNRLCNAIYKKIVTEDFFGLGQEVVTTNISKPAFTFSRSAEKINEFMAWLDQQVKEGILSIKQYEQIGTSIESAWTNLFIVDTYKRGVIRARYELQKAGYDVPSIDATGGVEMSMLLPIHVERLGLLFTRVFSDLKGITDAMDSIISRLLAQGMADGDGSILITRKILGAINGTGMGDLSLTDTLGRFIPARTRATILARTEIVRAHHQAMINEYRNWTLENIIVLAEVITAGDDRVCSLCEAMAAKGPYTLDEAENLIPNHPQCRCIALPYEVGVDILIPKK